jgi:hypothetical protein
LARADAVRDYHLRNRHWFVGEVWHAEIHVLAENALVLQQLGTAEKLEELDRDGLDRHEGVHAIGVTYGHAIVDWAMRADEDRPDVELEAFIVRSIESLTVASWRARPSSAFVWQAGYDWIDALGDRRDRIDRDLRRKILAFGADGIAALVAVIENAIVRPQDDTRSLRAARLLRVFEDEQTAERMTRAVETEREKRLFDRIDAALTVVGVAAVATVIARIEGLTPEGVELRTWCELLSSSKLQDDRILAFLIRSLRREPGFVAGCLLEYGHPEALVLAHREFEALQLTGDTRADQIVSGFVDAIEMLGGQLTARERELVALHHAEVRRARGGAVGTA